MKHLTYILFFVLIGATTQSCIPDENFLPGTIIDSGDPALDGCGWLLEVGTFTYKPTELDAAFQKDGLQVNVEFTETNTSISCGLVGTEYDEITIQEIQEL